MKIALITGASGNLGRVVCKQFIIAGYKVIAIVGMSDQIEEFSSDGMIDVHRVDLGSEMEVNQLCEEICTMYQRIHVGLFLAGGFALNPIGSSGKEQLDAMYRLNFETAYFCSRQIFMHMQKQGGGRLFFVGARPALEPAAAAGMLPYALSKSLVIKLSEIYNAAGKKNNVVSHVIVPSVIDTPANRKSNPDADFSKWVSPEKIGATILFACSDEGAAIREGIFKLYGES